jgi:Domain of unknown function (DUF4340)
MKARTRSLLPLLVLLVLAGGVVAYAFYGVEKKDQATQARKDSDARLYLFDRTRVKKVAVEAKGATTVVVREGDGWRIEAPVKAEAERATVDSLVERLSSLRRKAVVAEKPDDAALEGYGLASPRARVTLSVEGGKDETFALGDDNAFDGTAFVRTTSGSVDLVPGDVKYAVERSTFDLREKRLLPFEEKDLARVEVTAPKLAYALARDGDSWRLDAPVKEKADEATVQRVLGAVRGLRATDFGPGGGDAARALARPAWKVRLVDAKGGAREVALGAAPDAKGKAGGAPKELFARVSGSDEVAKVSAGSEKDLEQDLFALREKKVLHFDRDAVARLVIERGAEKIELTREPAGDAGPPEAWKLVAPRAAPASAGKIPSLLWTLSTLQAKAFADESGSKLAAYGLDHPALTVTMSGADGKALDRLLVSAERGGKTYAKAASAPRIVEVDASALASLPDKADALVEKPAVEAKAAQPKTN